MYCGFTILYAFIISEAHLIHNAVLSFFLFYRIAFDGSKCYNVFEKYRM